MEFPSVAPAPRSNVASTVASDGRSLVSVRLPVCITQRFWPSKAIPDGASPTVTSPAKVASYQRSIPIWIGFSPRPGRPCGPIGPAGPAAPAGPCAPAGPADPVAPVAPFAPLGPAGPCGPVAPVAPCGPAGPVAPVAPFAPLGPTGPC